MTEQGRTLRERVLKAFDDWRVKLPSDRGFNHYEGEAFRNALIEAVNADALLTPGRADEGATTVCEWTLDADERGDSWDAKCGEKWCFIEGDPEDNRIRFCHGCGRPVVLVYPERHCSHCQRIAKECDCEETPDGR